LQKAWWLNATPTEGAVHLGHLRSFSKRGGGEGALRATAATLTIVVSRERSEKTASTPNTQDPPERSDRRHL